MTQLLLYATCNVLDPKLIRRIHRSVKDIPLRKYLTERNYIRHVIPTQENLNLLDIARRVSECDMPFMKGILSINRAKQFRHIRYQTKMIILTESELKIIAYEFYRNGYNIASEECYALTQFYTGFIYLVLLGDKLQVFKTRDDAVKYGINASSKQAFSVYIIRTIHKGTPYYTYMGSNDTELDFQFCEEILDRMKTLPDNKLYDMFMEYIGYEIDTYNKNGELIRAMWDNGTTKSFMDFANPDAIAEMRTMQHPLLWERVDEEC